MNKTKKFAAFAAAALACATFLTACATSSDGGRLGAMTREGLQRVVIDGLGFLAIRPGTSLPSYTKVYIEPVDVEFARGWRGTSTGSRLPASPERMAELERDIQATFMREFSAAVATNPRIELVDRAGAGVLKLSPRLTDVRLSTLDSDILPGETMTRDVGHVEIDLAMHDGATDQLLTRMQDGRDGVRSTARTASATSSMAEIGRIFSAWGTVVGQGILTLSLETGKPR